MAKQQQLKLNPALKQLEVLVGDWDMEISGASFLPNPQAKVHGPVSFKWIENGAFLIMCQGDKGTPQAKWLIGRDDSTNFYKVLYFDARGVSRVYEMSFKNDVLKIWRNSPHFSQRYKGVISKNRNTITAEWEKSTDGKEWEHDFNIKYTRLK
jgi:hypothetical protein